MRMTTRAALAAMVIGLGLQASVADAGLRHFRLFCSGCGPVYAAPAYVASPAPVCACGASAMSYSPPACCQSSVGGGMLQPELVGPAFDGQTAADPQYPPYPVTATLGGYGNGFGSAPMMPTYGGGLPYQYTPFPIVAGDDLVW